MSNVFRLKKNTCCIVGTLEVLGLRGFLGVKLIVIIAPALNLCSIFKMELC